MSSSSLRSVFDEYERDGVISQVEIESILGALALLKRESGWGRIELVVKGSELNDII